MKKILFFVALSFSFLFAINVQKASKDELMCIKGIGDKKANAILKYRKSHKLKSADDLLEIKGFGKVLVKNVAKDVKSVACGGKASKKTKKSSSDKKVVKKIDKKSPKKTDKKTEEKRDKKTEEKRDKKTEEKRDKKTEEK